MNKQSKIILNSIGISILAFIVINTISFLIQLSNTELVNEWNFKWNDGTYYINNNPTGLELWNSEAVGFLFLIFIVSFIMGLKKERKLQTLKEKK